ncbi:hypothetical protein FGO68_gene773 [Halteria grandinella]|uniref:Uncharacterized protein n=1 Tax=Halteria grandinella TaxID=5974 RepID=A0A8J8STZ5_HALGN|nr:hypothetical protein FGO68_gene773 [Halteria grandinella]
MRTGWGQRPSFTPRHQVARDTGIGPSGASTWFRRRRVSGGDLFIFQSWNFGQAPSFAHRLVLGPFPLKFKVGLSAQSGRVRGDLRCPQEAGCLAPWCAVVPL